MILSDLLNDADKAGDAAGAFRILLATRTVDGQLLEPGQVQISDAGVLQVDASAGEIDVLPSRFMDPEGECVTMAVVRRLVVDQPGIADYTLTGVIGFKRLADGGNAQRTNPIIGTYVQAEDQEIWLLLHPQEQWPA